VIFAAQLVSGTVMVLMFVLALLLVVNRAMLEAYLCAGLCFSASMLFIATFIPRLP